MGDLSGQSHCQSQCNVGINTTIGPSLKGYEYNSYFSFDNTDSDNEVHHACLWSLLFGSLVLNVMDPCTSLKCLHSPITQQN